MNKDRKQNDRREQLKGLSKQAAKLRILNPSLEHETINNILIDFFYKDETHQIFKTFNGWKAEGFKIRKGAKGFAIWARPKDVEKVDGEKMDYYPICYLFSNAQAEKNHPYLPEIQADAAVFA